MGNATAFVSLALFVVWMQRQGRWGLFFKSITGQTEIAGSRNDGSGGAITSPATPLVPPATTPGQPATLIPNAPTTPPGTVGGTFA